MMILRSIWGALLVSALTALPATACADTQIGIQVLSISGSHFENGNNVRGSSVGAFFEITQRWRNLRVHLEGIPTVNSVHAKSARFGEITQSLGLFNGVVSVPIDRGGRFWAGIGTGVVAQRTPQYNFPLVGENHVNSSRLAGTRYELRGSWRSRNATFFETTFADQPHMRGPDVVNANIFGFASERSQSEDARMLDLSTAYGIDRGPMEYAVGVRWINFSANFVDGHAADRNVGFGPTLEVRYSL